MEGFPNQQNGATRQEIYAYRLGRRQAMGVAQEREARRGHNPCKFHQNDPQHDTSSGF